MSVELRPLTEKSARAFKFMCMNALPVRVPDSVYGDMLRQPFDLVKTAYVDEMMVGGIACKVEASSTGESELYIQVLVVLTAYQRKGIGRQLLVSVLSSPLLSAVHSVKLHVQTSNEAAVAFYSSFGFEIVETIRGCYKRIDPPDAHVMKKIVVAKPFRCRVSSDVAVLDRLHKLFPWIPGESDIRPPVDVLERKRQQLHAIQSQWVTFPDYIRASVFGVPSVLDPSTLKLMACGDDSAVTGRSVFAPNEFPYNVPKHFVMWYGPCDGPETSRNDECITADIAAAMDDDPGLRGSNFVWYVNPKMTVPEYFHVQVFLEPPS